MIEKNFESSKRVLLLDGIYPPIPTPFDDRGRIAVNALESNLQFLDQFKLRGFVVLGSNGEYVMLSEEEKLLVMETARAAIPADKLMIAGTGCQATGETLNLTKKAADIGADAALVITPSYYTRLMTPEALINHFHIIADDSPIPILIYNMPACTGIDLDEETLSVLGRHPNIIGLKDSSGNVTKMGTIRQQVGPGFQILAGSGGFLLPALSVGAIGGIMALANIVPNACIAIRQYYLEGRQTQARELQLRMIPVNTAVTSRWGVPALKAAMDILGMYGGPVRLPLLPISNEIRKRLNSILVNSGLITP
ncbi:MAG: dihydrodipicolinate synthase family protein [Candidatus Aminicenantes bacterium]|nr:MAG: dihydrodipicolinate synthase family protein [Candidatus Aminicenantes bacterium]